MTAGSLSTDRSCRAGILRDCSTGLTEQHKKLEVPTPHSRTSEKLHSSAHHGALEILSKLSSKLHLKWCKACMVGEHGLIWKTKPVWCSVHSQPGVLNTHWSITSNHPDSISTKLPLIHSLSLASSWSKCSLLFGENTFEGQVQVTVDLKHRSQLAVFAATLHEQMGGGVWSHCTFSALRWGPLPRKEGAHKSGAVPLSAWQRERPDGACVDSAPGFHFRHTSTWLVSGQTWGSTLSPALIITGVLLNSPKNNPNSWFQGQRAAFTHSL